MPVGMHDGHRERLRNKIRKFGFDCLEDHEKLEYLLYAYIPRRDTNPIAHELIDSFGSFRKVLEADTAALAAVKGMTENAALYLHTLPDVFSSYLTGEDPGKLTSPKECAEYMIARLGRKRQEHFIILYLDEEGNLLKTATMTEERNRAVSVNRDKLIAAAVACKAQIVVIGHNHPHGDILPSDADIESTNRIAQALSMVGIRLGDHIIFSERTHHSMMERGEIFDPVKLNGSLTQFAQGLVRRENDVNRLKRPR